MRALEPDVSGYVRSTGAQIYYEAFGSGPATVLLMPPWQVVYARTWKMQIPYLARHYRVIVYDPRGNGKSSRPAEADAYTYRAHADDALAVLNACGEGHATIVGYSRGGIVLAMLATQHPERVDGAIFLAPVAPLGPPRHTQNLWDKPLESDDGWAKHNKHYWLRAYDDWLDFFAHKLFTESHSTMGIENVNEWGRQTSAEVLIATYEAPRSNGEPPADHAAALAYYARIRCPVLVIHGSDDAVIAHSTGAGVAEATGGALVTIEGGGHSPHARHPVKVNLLIRRFVDGVIAGHPADAHLG